MEDNLDVIGESTDLTDEEQEDLSSVGPDAKNITYSGQDFDIDGLIRRLMNRDILIPTFGHEGEEIESAGFQRAFVWRKPQMDKFIESILLGYPVPGVFLIKQSDNRYLVLDGQQRLLTLRLFREGLHQGREFRLHNVADEFKDLTYESLSEPLRRKFDNTFIQAIIVISDGTSESLEAIYRIFERLNAGGTQLTPHEIRVALFAGEFIDFIEQMNKLEPWRNLYGKKSPRLRDQELVLRIYGLVYQFDDYRRPMKQFLNDVASSHRRETMMHNEEFAYAFERSARLLVDSVGPDAFRVGKSQVNAALGEAVMVGLIQRIRSSNRAPSKSEIEEAVHRLKSEVRDAFSRSTADETQVALRISRSCELFSGG